MLTYDEVQRAVNENVEKAFYNTRGPTPMRPIIDLLKQQLARDLWRDLNPDRLISYGEAARQLGVSDRQIHRIVKDNQIPIIVISKMRRGLRWGDLLNLIREKTKSPSGA